MKLLFTLFFIFLIVVANAQVNPTTAYRELKLYEANLKKVDKIFDPVKISGDSKTVLRQFVNMVEASMDTLNKNKLAIIDTARLSLYFQLSKKQIDIATKAFKETKHPNGDYGDKSTCYLDSVYTYSMQKYLTDLSALHNTKFMAIVEWFAKKDYRHLERIDDIFYVCLNGVNDSYMQIIDLRKGLENAISWRKADLKLEMQLQLAKPKRKG